MGWNAGLGPELLQPPPGSATSSQWVPEQAPSPLGLWVSPFISRVTGCGCLMCAAGYGAVTVGGDRCGETKPRRKEPPNEGSLAWCPRVRISRDPRGQHGWPLDLRTWSCHMGTWLNGSFPCCFHAELPLGYGALGQDGSCPLISGPRAKCPFLDVRLTP